MKPEQCHADQAAVVPRLLVGLVSVVCRCPRLVLALAIGLCALSAMASYRYLEYHTQRTDLISPHKEYQQRWRRYLAEFGDDDDVVVVVRDRAGALRTPNRERMEQALEALAARVRRRPESFDRLFYKVDLHPLHNRALLFLPVEQIKTIQENLGSMDLLLRLGPISWQQLTLASLLDEASQRTRRLTADKPLSHDDDQFFTQLRAVSHSARALLIHPADYRNPWSSLVTQPAPQRDLLAEPQYFFSEGDALAFLLVRPIKEAGSFTAAQKSVTAMREIVAAATADFPEVEFGLTGLPVLETDEMAAAQHDTQLASWLAIAGVTLLFFLVYRGIAYPLLTVATLLVGTAWAMGWLTLTVGHLNILSATFAVMLIGMGDYGVLWVMRYEQARRFGMDVRSALLHTARHVAIGNLTAATTLALAFFAAMFADFQAVAELGWIAGCGVLLCALACFTVLPALLMVCDRRLQIGSTDDGYPRSSILDFSAKTQTWLPTLAGWRRSVLGAGLGLTAVMAICAFRVGYDHNLLHLQARDLESVKWELTLIEHTAGASWHALSCTTSPEEALALKSRYEQLPEVSRVVEVASLVPRDQDHKLDLLRDIRHRLAALPPRGVPLAHARPDRAQIAAQLARLIAQVTPLSQEARQPLLAGLHQDLQALANQLARMPEAVTVERLQEFDRRLAGDLAEDLHRLRDVATPEPIVLADLPAELRERYVGSSGKWLLRVFARDCLWEFKPLEHFTRQIAAIDPEATGKPFATVEGLKAMKNGFQWAGLYALLVIVAVLRLDFRSWHRTLLAVTPLAMGVVLSLGSMGLCGLPLNPANMIAFPLILGVGVDNGVHVLHDYLLRRAEGQTTISYAIGRGVLVKAMTTMIGFGALMISSQRGLAGLGLILTLGVACCMLSALIVLPALLRMLGRREQIEPAMTPESLPLRKAA
jgi:hopanoid biosynthesis associated RND transporter like protein HpnN